MFKRIIKVSLFMLFAIMSISSCKKIEESNPYNDRTTAVFNPDLKYGTVTDQDGNIYKTVTIGTQTWMAENLRTTKYNDGTEIPKIANGYEWVELSTGAYCNQNNTLNVDIIATYGRLYNWYAVNTGKLAPEGWHVPTDAEWSTLTTYLGGETVAGSKLKETGDTHWGYFNSESTNYTGFTALPGGLRNSNGEFLAFEQTGDWWSATENDATYAWGRWMEHWYDISYTNRSSHGKKSGFSVRCIKD